MAVQTDYDIRYDAFGRPYYVPKEAGPPPAPAQSILTVKGRKGAEAFKMAPKSQALLLDSTQPVVWFKAVDEAGEETLDGYDLSPHTEPAEETRGPEYAELDTRLKKIEDLLEVMIHGSKPDHGEAGDNE